MLIGRETSVTPCLACCYCDLTPDKRMDGWMDLGNALTLTKCLSESLCVINCTGNRESVPEGCWFPINKFP